ncbi:hypothetical protein EWB00_009337, partial [Schistosoma japonicum]
MGKKVVHDIPTYFFMHNSSPPINLHPQHLAIILIWGRRLCTTFTPIFSCTTHHRQSTYTHNISPSSLYGEEGCARHSTLFFHAQLITANQLTPTTSRHHLDMGKKVVHDIPPLFFHAQLITANQLTPTTSRHHLYMGKKVVHDIHTYFFMHNSSPPINLHPQHPPSFLIWGRRLCTTFTPIFHAQLITANQLTPTTSRHHLDMGKKVVHDIHPYFFMHNSSPPINLHPQHLAIIFSMGKK